MPSDDGYPIFTKDELAWFYKRVCELVRPDRHEDVNVGRRKAGLDLELVIAVAPRSRRVFTMKVCKQLAAEVARRTGVAPPLVYVYGDPHREAREALNHAMHQC